MQQCDVRVIIPRERHAKVFEIFDALAPEEAFEVNDHDPGPLHHQFQTTRGGQLSWEYPEEGPKVWRVKIGRV